MGDLVCFTGRGLVIQTKCEALALSRRGDSSETNLGNLTWFVSLGGVG